MSVEGMWADLAPVGRAAATTGVSPSPAEYAGDTDCLAGVAAPARVIEALA
jgi:hypothetical protein